MSKLAMTFVTIAVIAIFNSAILAEGPLDLGDSEYRSSCASCHGNDGKGYGPVSPLLKLPSADLTILARKNNGVFPVSTLYEIIDGRKVIAAHGTREMPIWGYRYMLDIKSAASPSASDRFVSFSYDPESIVRMRILLVIDYLNRIQQK